MTNLEVDISKVPPGILLGASFDLRLLAENGMVITFHDEASDEVLASVGGQLVYILHRFASGIKGFETFFGSTLGDIEIAVRKAISQHSRVDIAEATNRVNSAIKSVKIAAERLPEEERRTYVSEMLTLLTNGLLDTLKEGE